ncbi:hypothetical protein AB840_13100 [Megasphaera cerevisiae DSM 20462]|uniref:4Fe-4S ferredoxin-type domain-containing protein n=1 Tax=Megasphaera cerevisiae DSM 20462 TaxID=1122219 RepID=A0A0J6ZL16_9FIRM|nr:Coenzyme F420 hydrogenase/dehydrogenase, beta subunit C-terminal domain [Megasphaera cerevisiae]KMO85526.1 hypothetical protein AB840_13100 [Megasphaera cerevisiae DSM 20462]SKA06623.1 Coenzyme F420-reducing hydrogenase, beta subunit [Megasphaera cerevisiae DSM 20462]
MKIEYLLHEGKQNCTGCMACVNSCSNKCISIQTDIEGFWYPVINHHSCIQCGKCDSSCPISSTINDQKEKSIIYAAINLNDSIRYSSSSGGIFQLLAEKILANGGIVVGAMFNEKWEVVHGCVEHVDELYKLRGSKYVQSCIRDTYRLTKEYLQLGRKVLFSGTPCQIAGLKQYLKKEYTNLVTVDLICHGVPSPLVWKKYVALRSNGKKISRIFFRNKNLSWERFLLEFSFENSSKYLMPLDKDLYLKGFLSNLYLRPSCYSCHFKGIQRKSDITLADFWGIDEILPDMNDHKGTSLVFVHTAKGRKVFSEIQDKANVKQVDLSLDEITRYNSSMVQSVGCNPKRKRFFKELSENKLPIDILIDKYTKVDISTRIYRDVRRKAASISILKKVYKKIF